MREHLYKEVGLSGIATQPNRLRVLRPEVVDAIASSFNEIGQKQPIVVRPAESEGFWLVAGKHRLEAARKLKWESISALVLDGVSADEALLAEIDENLVRADLSPAERAAHEAARKAIYVPLHPQTKQGGAPGAGKGKGKKLALESGEVRHLPYTKKAAKETGRSERTVRENTRRGRIPNVIALTDTSLDKGEELDALASLNDANPEAALDLMKRAEAGEKVSAKVELKKQKRKAKETALAAKQHALPDARFGVILADPEWRFEPWSRESGMDRAADNHYPTSVTEVIASRPVAKIAADDCVLFLWATVPMLPQALLVMAAWGFDYRTHFAWAKDRFGTGYWNRNKHELLLIGVRGSPPAPAQGEQWDSLLSAPVGEHSAKPKLFLELVEAYFPNLPKIELNCRDAPRPGWDAWGNEVLLAAE